MNYALIYITIHLQDIFKCNSQPEESWLRLTFVQTGSDVGRLAATRDRRAFDIKANDVKISANWKKFKLQLKADGYEYTW